MIEIEIMNGNHGLTRFLVLMALWLSVSAGRSWADEPESGRDDQLSLADLAEYRAALSGKPTADDARPSDLPVNLGFRDLWERPEAYRGRRVTVRGRVARTFRQGPVGTFPPLLQVWTFSPAGDPFCLVFPQERDQNTPSLTVNSKGSETRAPKATIPGPGRPVQFTGTFLKMIRYAAGDGARMAPLIVGDRPPGPATAPAADPADVRGDHSSAVGKDLRAIRGKDQDTGHRGGDNGFDEWGGSSGWGLWLMIAVVAAGMLARQHMRATPFRSRSAMRERLRDLHAPDPPLEFIDHSDSSPV